MPAIGFNDLQPNDLQPNPQLIVSTRMTMKSLFYERLFLLNRCLEQAGEILEQFQQEGLVHPDHVAHRKRSLEHIRADLSFLVTGLLHRRELEQCAGLAQPQKAPVPKLGE